MIAILLLLLGCAPESTAPAITVEAISCTPDETVEQVYTRAVYAARGLTHPQPERWDPIDWMQEDEILAYRCPGGGVVELLAY